MARVAREVAGIDVLVIGHSHREVADTTINGVLVVQPRNWATSVATVAIGLERAGTGWQVVSRRGRLIQARDHAEQGAVVRAVARAHQSAVRYANEVIGRTEVAWHTDSARVRDEPLIDLIQAAQRRATGAQLSIASAFTLDARLEPGPITVRQIAQLYPYENSLRALRLSGAQLRAFLEHSARYWIVEGDGAGGFRTRPDPTIPGYNYDILAGADYVVDLARPIGSRITTLTFQGRPIAETDTFTVAVNNYRAGGAGGYAMLRGAPVVYESPTEIRDLVIAEVRRRGVLKPEEIGERNYRLLPPRRTVRVLAINDFHGALTKRPVGTIGNRGGVAELATMIREAGAECAPTCVPLVLHGGDMFQGTAASNLAFGRTVVPILEALDVAAGALGNHEFDWGQDTLRARMRELRPLILGANVRDPDGGDIDWIPDDTLVTREGVRIGIIGLADPGTPRTTMPRYVANLRFLPPALYVRERAAALRARGAEAVVVVAHIGGFCEIAAPDQCRGEILELAKELPTGFVDAIVSGHTHSAITTVVNGIPVVQARSSGQALGVIDLPLGGTPSRPELRAVVSDSVRRDPTVAALVAEAEAAVASRIAAPVTTAEARFARAGDQYPLGNLIADAQRAAGRGDLAVMNNGGIRTEIRQGVVTWGDLFEVQPFGNRLVAVTIRGDALRRYLEALVDGRGIRYHLSGVTIEYDASAPSGSRLRSVRFDDGRALENGRRYRLVMTDFLASGGDGAALTREARVDDLNRVDLDALIQHLQGLPGGRLTLTPALQAPRIKAIR
ncbi:MAG: 5'-nucleotidase C-terminal domain-containing protein [Gemmatimonadaceae bacterium]